MGEWLQSLLFPPAYKILAIVPYERRYQEERRYTIALSKRYELLNIAYGASPLKRGPMPPEVRAKVSRAKRRAASAPAVAA